MLDERFDDKNSMDGTDAYSRLSDQADEEAYDELASYIQDKLDDFNTRECLLSVALIWQSKGTTAEKYGLIGDIFEVMISGIASKNSKFD